MVVDYKRIELFGKLLIEKAVLDAPETKPIPMREEACFLYVIGGHLRDFSETDSVDVPAREGVLMKCGSYVGRLEPDPESGHYEAIAVHFYPDILKRIYETEVPDILKRPRSRPAGRSMARVESDVLLARYIESLQFYFEHPDIVSNELLVLKVKELIMLLGNTHNAPAVYEILSNLFTPDTRGFKEVIEAHLLTDISVAELAALTNRSLATFKRTFQKVYGDSPGRYIRNRRLEKAAEFLLATDAPVGQVAYDCGYADVAHFSRSFKARFGHSPRAFRAARAN